MRPGVLASSRARVRKAGSGPLFELDFDFGVADGGASVGGEGDVVDGEFGGDFGHSDLEGAAAVFDLEENVEGGLCGQGEGGDLVGDGAGGDGGDIIGL